MGDFNAKVGSSLENFEKIMGEHDMGETKMKKFF